MATDVGIRIGVEGEKEFKSSLAAVNAQIKNLNTEMQSVVASFEGMENSEEAVTAKSDILQRSIEVQQQKLNLLSGQYDRSKGKLDELSRELDQAAEQFGANSKEASKAQQAYNRQAAEVNRLGSQMNATEADIRKMQRQLENTEDSVGDLTDEMEDAEKTASSFGDTLKAAFLGGSISGAVQSLAGSISSLVSETMEYRKILGTLDTSSQKAGYTAEETAESYKQLYGIIGDDQQSATALANLQALGLKQEELKQMTDAAIGAWATYGDSIPIDSLAEAINETIQAGAVTGTFADVLNWAGTSEDDFNAALESCPDKASRVNLVMEELAKQGLAETAEAWRQNNADIVAMQEAEADLKDVTADFGALLTPLMAESKQGLADLLRGVLNLLNGSSPLLPFLTAAGTGIAGLALPVLIANLAASAKNVTLVKTAFAAFNVVLNANPIAVVITLLAALTVGLVTAYKTNERFREIIDDGWNAVKNSIITNSKSIITEIKAMPAAWAQVGRDSVNSIRNLPEQFKKIGLNFVKGLWSGISSGGSWLTGQMKNWANSIVQSAKSFFGVHSPSVLFEEIGAYLVQGLGLGISENQGYAVSEIEKLGNAILNTGNSISTGLITVNERTGVQTYNSLYKNMMKRLSLYDKERNKRIMAIQDATEDNIEAINREVEATRTATDAKIKLYQQEYAAKISLIDDETSAATKALQAQIDAINAQQEQENRAEEELEYIKKMQELQQEYDSAETAEERYKVEQEMAETERSRKKQLLQQERQDKIESLRDEMDAIREQADQKKAALQEELEAKQYQLEQQRLREIEYLQQVIALMQSQVDKKKELEELQTQIVKKEKELQTKKIDAETKKQTQAELDELKEREKNLKASLTTDEQTLKDFLPKIQNISNQYGDAFLSGFKSTEDQIKNYIAGIANFAKSYLSTITSQFIPTQGFKINGSHKTGLSYVPFDGYIAQLHKGERVLTAGENRTYTNSQAGSSVQNIFHVQATIREEADIKRVAQELYNMQKSDARGKGVVVI